MCNLYESDMTPDVMRTLKDQFSLVDTAYLDVLRGRNGPQRVYPKYDAPVIRSWRPLMASYGTSHRCAEASRRRISIGARPPVTDA